MTIPPKPKAPLTIYFRFLRDNRQTVRDENPKISNTEFARILSREYKNMSADQKKNYDEEYKKEKVVY